jgi:hypothetical protein
MHTFLVIAAGFVLLGLCLALGNATSLGLAGGAKLFVPLWFLGAAVNMYVGVARAGYSIADEAPVFLVVFALPAVVAIVLIRRFVTG